VSGEASVSIRLKVPTLPDDDHLVNLTVPEHFELLDGHAVIILVPAPLMAGQCSVSPGTAGPGPDLGLPSLELMVRA
jgi:hypothetical protein